MKGRQLKFYFSCLPVPLPNLPAASDERTLPSAALALLCQQSPAAGDHCCHSPASHQHGCHSTASAPRFSCRNGLNLELAIYFFNFQIILSLFLPQVWTHLLALLFDVSHVSVQDFPNRNPHMHVHSDIKCAYIILHSHSLPDACSSSPLRKKWQNTRSHFPSQPAL